MTLKYDKELLVKLCMQGKPTYEIAPILGASPVTICRWMRKIGLKSLAKRGPVLDKRSFKCSGCGDDDSTHARVNYRSGRPSLSRCKACQAKSTILRYRFARAEAIAYAGGCCQICLYDRYVGSLHFHHLDPNTKDSTWKNMKI